MWVRVAWLLIRTCGEKAVSLTHQFTERAAEYFPPSHELHSEALELSLVWKPALHSRQAERAVGV